MPDKSFLSWPFFEDRHRTLASDLDVWCERELRDFDHGKDVDAACRAVVKKFGDAGWLRYSVPKSGGGHHERLDVRSICLIREMLARRSGLAEFAFALQGLGSGPISQFGSEELKKNISPEWQRGRAFLPSPSLRPKQAPTSAPCRRRRRKTAAIL